MGKYSLTIGIIGASANSTEYYDSEKVHYEVICAKRPEAVILAATGDHIIFVRDISDLNFVNIEIILSLTNKEEIYICLPEDAGADYIFDYRFDAEYSVMFNTDTLRSTEISRWIASCPGNSFVQSEFVKCTCYKLLAAGHKATIVSDLYLCNNPGETTGYYLHYADNAMRYFVFDKGNSSATDVINAYLAYCRGVFRYYEYLDANVRFISDEEAYSVQNALVDILKGCGMATAKQLRLASADIRRLAIDFIKSDRLSKNVSEWYYIMTGTPLNLANPVTYNEKIQWLKVYDSTPLKTQLADKYAVREWVSERIGSKYLIPLYGVWDSFKEIDFKKLPNEFALKCNHGSGMNILVHDKESLDRDYVEKKITTWLRSDYSTYGYEVHYAGIKPRVLAEKLLKPSDGSSEINDYKVFVFNGKAKLIQVDIDRGTKHTRNIYDTNWKLLPVSINYPRNPAAIEPRPACLSEMLSVAEKLGMGFRHVRVDFYICDGHIYFGEMTFTHASGTATFEPDLFAKEMGSWIEL